MFGKAKAKRINVYNGQNNQKCQIYLFFLVFGPKIDILDNFKKKMVKAYLHTESLVPTLLNLV